MTPTIGAAFADDPVWGAAGSTAVRTGNGTVRSTTTGVGAFLLPDATPMSDVDVTLNCFYAGNGNFVGRHGVGAYVHLAGTSRYVFGVSPRGSSPVRYNVVAARYDNTTMSASVNVAVQPTFTINSAFTLRGYYAKPGTLYVYLNGVLQLTLTDPTPISGDGKVGAWFDYDGFGDQDADGFGMQISSFSLTSGVIAAMPPATASSPFTATVGPLAAPAGLTFSTPTQAITTSASPMAATAALPAAGVSGTMTYTQASLAAPAGLPTAPTDRKSVV